MKKYFTHITLFCFFISAGAVVAMQPAPSVQWDRASAMAEVRSADIDIVVSEIGNAASLADGEATMERLRELENRSDLPLPAREAALYEFTRSLAGLPRSAVAAEVMEHLRSYQAQALVPDEDHGRTLVPLFNIRGAAAGVEHGWQRSESAIKAMDLLETNPETLVSAYIESANRNQRSGYLDALRQADLADVETVQQAVLEQFSQEPDLTRLLGLTSVITTDPVAIQQLLIYGRGAGLSSLFKQLDEKLSAAETAEFLTFAVQQAPVENASLAIAAWWPRLRHEAAIRDLLVEKLDDPALGSTAALALAQNPDIQTIKVLQDTAGGSSIAAQRAQMALDMNRDRLIGDVRQ